jgi:flagellar biosynthesis anti-sigma factor FlgM
MKANDSNCPSANSPATVRSEAVSEIQLSELVRSLRALAADSPERQARLEEIALAYANGAYQVDAEEVASKIIDDAIEP